MTEMSLSLVNLGLPYPYLTLAEAVALGTFGDPKQTLPSLGESIEEICLFEAEATGAGDAYVRPEVVYSHPSITEAVEKIIGQAAASPEDGAEVWRQARGRRAAKERTALVEQALRAALQRGALVAFGKPAPAPFVRPPASCGHIEINPTDLIGPLILGGPLCPPSESWLVTTDRRIGRAIHAWVDVQLKIDQVQDLFCRSLPTIEKRATTMGSPAADCPVTAVQFADGDRHLLLRQWAEWKYALADRYPGRDQMLKDFREDFGKVRGINMQTIRHLLQALRTSEQKKGGAPMHRSWTD